MEKTKLNATKEPIKSSFFSLDNLKLSYVITISQQRKNIIKVFRWFRAPKINFRNNKLNGTTMTNDKSKTISQNILLKE